MEERPNLAVPADNAAAGVLFRQYQNEGLIHAMTGRSPALPRPDGSPRPRSA